MSSSTAPASSQSSAAPQGPDNRSPAASSNLYLVTFLATLFLLLFVSCAIVLRSYILRRRYQRRLDEAMAAGMLLAPRTQGSKRKRFGAKPKLFDAWLAGGGDTWDHIKPLSAQPVFVKRKYKDGPPKHISVVPDSYRPTDVEDLINNGIRPPSPSGSQTSPTTEDHPTALRSRVRNLWSRSRRNSTSSQNIDPADAEAEGGLTDTEVVPAVDGPAAGASEPASTAETKTTTSYKVRVEMLQVSVLIAMPSQNRTIRKNAVLDRVGRADIEEDDDDDDDDDAENVLPELVFGITRVHYRQSKAGKSAANPPSTPTSPSTQRKPQTMSVVPEEEEEGL
ncbi:hypothetical protein GALMADRAFT_220749 [Galerina marginata CBS 339.88]|uniref:Uncharacterized protein n=1 Tax=Galerina marginata (strain CBS 339.88) TaxID=685588 RepID=A0A067TS69_GALM3|nr:hypothetical protein GALMADRAFT_220749 [Galerina marginata CBS 339.88]